MKRLAFSVLIAVAAIVSATPLYSHAEGKGSSWYRVPLKSGEADGGYQWSASATGPKGHSLRRICVHLSIAEPSREGLPVEGEESAGCGRLKGPKDSVSASGVYGSGESATKILGVAYRPIVRKVVLELSSGRQVYFPTIPIALSRTRHNVPMFRYIVAFLDKNECLRRITTYGESETVIAVDRETQCD